MGTTTATQKRAAILDAFEREFAHYLNGKPVVGEAMYGFVIHAGVERNGWRMGVSARMPELNSTMRDVRRLGRTCAVMLNKAHIRHAAR